MKVRMAALAWNIKVSMICFNSQTSVQWVLHTRGGGPQLRKRLKGGSVCVCVHCVCGSVPLTNESECSSSLVEGTEDSYSGWVGCRLCHRTPPSLEQIQSLNETMQAVTMFQC